MKRHYEYSSTFNFPAVTKILFALLIFAIAPFQANAQSNSKIELLHADVSEFDESINPLADRLIGHVAFRHEGTLMNCDSAYLYRKENKIEAFGNVNIQRGDSLVMTGKYLLYEGNSKNAIIRNEVVLSDRKMNLKTQQLNYDMASDFAFYHDGGVITDADNTLTSKSGYYYPNHKDLYFKDSVVLTNPGFTMKSDTLRYNTGSSMAFFMGPTNIHSGQNLIYCESGWYHTKNETSLFTHNAFMKTPTQKLTGDTVMYDKNKMTGIGMGNVELVDSVNKIILKGNYAEHHEKNDSSYITGKATFVQAYDKDSLYLHSDSLKAVRANPSDTTSGNKNLFAYYQVKLFKSDLQGYCDSLVYSYADSTIHMIGGPVIWSGFNQLTADTIRIQTERSEISKMFLLNSAFITSQADTNTRTITDSTGFNQIKGKWMTGYFENSRLYRIDVTGNGQTIYYTQNKKNRTFGINRADCSDLTIYVTDNKVKQISLLTKPEGTLFPPNDLSMNERKLKGFRWLIDRRPASVDDIYKK